MTQISAKEGIIALGFSLMFIVFLSGCTTYPSGNNTTIVTGPNTIIIQNFSFTPAVLTINASQNVTWVNRDSVPHQIASNDGLFDSAALSTGASYTFEFDTPGNYTYHCAIHPFMSGQIIVLGPNQPGNETTNETNATQPENNTNETTPGGNETNQTTPVVNNTMLGTVVIQNFAFNPQAIAINTSQTVTWINEDTSYHRVVADNGMFDSSVLATGENYSFEFDTPGNYTYHCAIHPTMTGEVDVYGSEPATNNTNETVPPSNNTTAPAGNYGTVEIINNTFSPQNLTIDAEYTVMWTNEDNDTHEIVSSSFSSRDLNQGDTYNYTFEVPGTYTYSDGLNSSITGTITVLGAATNQTTPIINQTIPAMNATRMAVIDINDSVFIPQSVTVYVGGIVEWLNNDNITHNMKSALFAHNMSKGDSYVYQFDVPGTVVFWDDLNKSLTGTVVVVAKNATVTPANATIQLNATTIGIYSTGFKPSILTIEGGTKATWVNMDSVSHMVMSRTFQSLAIPPGGSYSRTFDNVGSFSYWDSANTMLDGQIIVN